MYSDKPMSGRLWDPVSYCELVRHGIVFPKTFISKANQNVTEKLKPVRKETWNRIGGFRWLSIQYDFV